MEQFNIAQKQFNIAQIKKYWEKYGTETFSPKLNKIIKENKAIVDKNIELNNQKEKLDNIKFNLENRGFDTTILKKWRYSIFGYFFTSY